MADISKVKIEAVQYDIKDQVARQKTDGHLIMNSSGVELTQRKTLQINNATIVDDPENNKTIVTPRGGGSGGGSGSTIAISTSESDFYGKEVFISHGDDVDSLNLDSGGTATLEGYVHTGWVTITCTASGTTMTSYLYVPYFGNYEVVLTTWSAKVVVTTNNEDWYGGEVHVSSRVAPPSTVTFDGTGRAVYTAQNPGEYTFAVYE